MSVPVEFMGIFLFVVGVMIGYFAALLDDVI